jgi:hypothetical protein
MFNNFGKEDYYENTRKKQWEFVPSHSVFVE